MKRKRPAGEIDILVNLGEGGLFKAKRMACVKTGDCLQSFHCLISANSHITYYVPAFYLFIFASCFHAVLTTLSASSAVTFIFHMRKLTEKLVKELAKFIQPVKSQAQVQTSSLSLYSSIVPFTMEIYQSKNLISYTRHSFWSPMKPVNLFWRPAHSSSNHINH